MRQAFIDAITDLARKNKKIFLLTGDLGFSVFEDFQKEFKDRFFNVGVAEQNMIGIAAGLGLCGKLVFVYSIAPFVTMRCLEQIRNDLCMQKLNVKLVGMGAGLYYGAAGPTHHTIDDIGIMRSLPEMTVVCPGSADETKQAIRASVSYSGPVYLRLGYNYGPISLECKTVFKLGKGILIETGSDITIVATGSLLYRAAEASRILEKRNISVRLINIHTIKPIDKNIILKAAKETKFIFTLEEHCLTGGLGTAVAEVLMESNSKVFFKRLSLKDNFVRDIGNREYLLERNSLSTEAIAATVLKDLKGKL